MNTQKKDNNYGEWAIVTGASEGIGKGFAKECASRGYNVVMIARRQPLLDDTAKSIEQDYGVKTKTLSLDLTAHDCVDQVKALCADLDIGLLVNNAAFSFPAEFLSMSESVISKQVHINVTVIAMLCHHFGNIMKQRGRGGIINVSSKTGEIAMPYFAMYSATKAFISTLSESLWYELKDHGVDVLALKPCQTATEGYLSRNPNIYGDDGIQTVEDCVSEAFSALGTHAGWLPWPPSRDDVKELRSMPLEDAISRNGSGMKHVFAKELG